MITLSGINSNSFAEVMTVLIIFVFVLALTYFVTRFIAGYQKGKTFSGNVEILETRKISQNKYIQIVRIGEKYLALGIGKDEMNVLTEINKEELVLQEVEPIQPFVSFKNFLEQAKNKKQ